MMNLNRHCDRTAPMLCVLLLSLNPAFAKQSVYHCRLADGSMSIQGSPCPSSTHTERLQHYEPSAETAPPSRSAPPSAAPAATREPKARTPARRAPLATRPGGLSYSRWFTRCTGLADEQERITRQRRRGYSVKEGAAMRERQREIERERKRYECERL